MSLALIRLMQLVSPVLPVGAYTYSQGLEWAVETGTVHSEAAAQVWIEDCLEFGAARLEAVYLGHMLRAWQQGQPDQAQALDAAFLASRETAELRAETLQMGHSLARLLRDLGAFSTQALGSFAEPSYPLVWSFAAMAWSVPMEEAVAGYLWAWLENQVMAAVKLVPFGQTAGQRLLEALGQQLPACAAAALQTPVAQTSNLLPAFAIASSCHETQYTRLFRS
jgi:urease accessory protein